MENTFYSLREVINQTKGSGTNAQTVTASSSTSKSALTQKGFRAVPNTGDIKSI